MPTFMEGLGQQAATTAVNQGLGAVFGLALEHHNDERQLEQEKNLQALHIQGSEQLTDYNYAKQLQFWHDTNYSAQLAEMEKAGINPALMYGMGGGGGTTTGSGSGASIGNQGAPGGGHEIVDAMAIQMQSAQLSLLNAQRANIEADTANKLGDAANKPKVGANLEASTSSLLQGVKNQKAQEILTQVQTELGKIDLSVKGETTQDMIDTIRGIAGEQMNKASIALSQAQVDAATIDEKIKIIKQEAIGAMLRNALTNADIQVDNAKIEQMKNDIMQRWQSLSQGQQQININKQQEQLNDWMEHQAVKLGWGAIGAGVLDKIASFIFKKVK